MSVSEPLSSTAKPLAITLGDFNNVADGQSENLQKCIDCYQTYAGSLSTKDQKLFFELLRGGCYTVTASAQTNYRWNKLYSRVFPYAKDKPPNRGASSIPGYLILNALHPNKDFRKYAEALEETHGRGAAHLQACPGIYATAYNAEVNPLVIGTLSTGEPPKKRAKIENGTPRKAREPSESKSSSQKLTTSKPARGAVEDEFKRGTIDDILEDESIDSAGNVDINTPQTAKTAGKVATASNPGRESKPKEDSTLQAAENTTVGVHERVKSKLSTKPVDDKKRNTEVRKSPSIAGTPIEEPIEEPTEKLGEFPLLTQQFMYEPQTKTTVISEQPQLHQTHDAAMADATATSTPILSTRSFTAVHDYPSARLIANAQLNESLMVKLLEDNQSLRAELGNSQQAIISLVDRHGELCQRLINQHERSNGQSALVVQRLDAIDRNFKRMSHVEKHIAFIARRFAGKEVHTHNLNRDTDEIVPIDLNEKHGSESAIADSPQLVEGDLRNSPDTETIDEDREEGEC